MNRQQRRQLARKNGWHGSNSKKGVPLTQALARADQQAEQEAYQAKLAKVQKAALATRDMGLIIPGQQ